MAKVTFLPQNTSFHAELNTKLLVTANRNKVPIRFGCASCRCGTCGIRVAVKGGAELSPMREDEAALLTRMSLPVDGTIRLACQTRLVGDGGAGEAAEVVVDLEFQDEYSPDQGEG